MAISPVFAVSPTVTVPAAYAGGAGEYQKWLSQLELQYASMLNQSQQRGMDRSAGLFGQVMDNAFAQGRMATNAALQDVVAGNNFQRGMIADQLRFANQQQLIGQRNQGDLAVVEARNQGNLLQQGMQTRAQIDQLVGSIDPQMLTPEGRNIHASVQRDLSALDADLRAGKIRPRDYAIGVSQITGRAAQLRSPRFQAQKPPTVQEMMQAGEIVFDDQRNLVIRKDPKNPQALIATNYTPNDSARYEPGRGVGDVWVQPGAGIVTRSKTGEVKVITSAEDILNSAAESMANEGIIRSEDPESYDRELRERFTRRMQIMLGEAQGEDLGQGGIPPQGGEGSVPGESPIIEGPNMLLPPGQSPPEESIWLQPFGAKEQEQFSNMLASDPEREQIFRMTAEETVQKLYGGEQPGLVPLEQIVAADAYLVSTGQNIPQRKIVLPEATDETIRAYLETGKAIMRMRPDGMGMGNLLAGYLAAINERIADYRASRMNNAGQSNNQPAQQSGP